MPPHLEKSSSRPSCAQLCMEQFFSTSLQVQSCPMTRGQSHPSPQSFGKAVKGLVLPSAVTAGAGVTPIPADCIPLTGMFQSRSQTTACHHQTCSEPRGRLHTAFLGRDPESLPTRGIHPAGVRQGGTWGQTATQSFCCSCFKTHSDFSPPALDGCSSRPGLQGWNPPATAHLPWKTEFYTGQQHPHPGLYPSKQ